MTVALLKLYFRSPAAIIGLLLLLAILAMAASAGWLYPRDPLSLAGRPLIWPFENPRFLLGTDNSGRDIAAQIFHGARFSLLIGLQAGTMLGGSVVVESVFSLPGLGRLAYESVVQRDLNTLLGIVFVSALLVITVNFIVDLFYARLDPRIAAEG